MHNNEQIIHSFYQSFQKLDAEGMAACYHPDIEFSDPAFPDLKGEMAANMWRMLCSQAQNFELTYSDVTADGMSGSANWQASYDFSRTGRRVHNKIQASFLFEDGKIIQHVDSFNFWRWSKMALGPVGLVLGWTPMLRQKVSTMANASLHKYCEQQKS
ncbi:nuclear transport factor 2 family protein [Planctobacterium marinum]|uniref:nuclear transport factor 2 family protein n=1 Tax=Planctobacterium marinum TaxID=1631968 RepID=UPI001E564F39|nr:nuclear transport factor 2 family protein [Planctobacterium marinum]MCC2607541.1 nuclear transport factor 2 family protein [Planctobacterium marinum]